MCQVRWRELAIVEEVAEDGMKCRNQEVSDRHIKRVFSDPPMKVTL